MAYLRAYQAKGDPGILGSIFKGVRKLAGVGLGIAMPGVGSIAGKAAGVIGKIPGGKKGALLAGGALAGGIAAGAMGEAVREGAFAGRKKYRRMNVGNTRALRRSMRRVQGFAKLARSTMTFTTHHRIKKAKRR